MEIVSTEQFSVRLHLAAMDHTGAPCFEQMSFSVLAIWGFNEVVIFWNPTP